MPFNGGGTFTLSSPAFTPGTTISSTAVNADFSDIATNGLSKCVVIDGQNTITGQLKFPNGTAAAPAHTFASDLTTGIFYPGTKKLGFSAGGIAAVLIDQNNVGSGQTGNQIYLANTAILNPVGMVIDFAAATPPAGWLICNAQVVAQATYPELFQIIGSTWNTGGEGAGNFRLPDCRGRASYGQDSGGSARITVAGGNFDGTVLGGGGGVQNQTLTQAQLPNLALAFAGSPVNTGTIQAPAGFPGGDFAGGILTNVPQGGPTSVVTTSSGSTWHVTLTAAGTVTAAGSTNLGSGNSHPILGPAIIFNKIIFAGRP